MALIELRQSWLIAAFASMSVAACGANSGLSPDAVQSTSAPAMIRFVNGSSDANAVSITVPLANTVAHVAYGTVAPPSFEPLPSNTIVTVTVQQDAASYSLDCKTPYALLPGGFYTVVIAGSVSPSLKGSNQGLQCQLFFENYSVLAASPDQVLFHNASPILFNSGVVALNFGRYTPDSAVPLKVGDTQPPGPIDGTAPFVASIQPGTNTAAGALQVGPFSSPQGSKVGFYAAANNHVQGTVLPGSAQLGAAPSAALPNMNNFFPIANATTISIYAIDPQTGVTAPVILVGVLD